jgi:hypothetical protein
LRTPVSVIMLPTRKHHGPGAPLPKSTSKSMDRRRASPSPRTICAEHRRGNGFVPWCRAEWAVQARRRALLSYPINRLSPRLLSRILKNGATRDGTHHFCAPDKHLSPVACGFSAQKKSAAPLELLTPPRTRRRRSRSSPKNPLPAIPKKGQPC